MEYIAEIDGGQGGSENFTADSAPEALLMAVEWAATGDWPEGGCTVIVTVTNEEDEGDTLSDSVEMEGR